MMDLYSSNVTWCLSRRQYSRLSKTAYNTIQQYGVRQIAHARRAFSYKFSSSVGSTYFLVFSADGEKLASSHADHTVRVSDVNSNLCLHVLSGHPRTVWSVAFHPSDSCLIATGCLNGVVKVWDLNKDCKLVSKTSCDSNVTSLAFHPSERVLLIAAGNQLLFWSCNESKPFAKSNVTSFYERVRLAKFGPHGNFIITGILQAEHEEFCKETYEAICHQNQAQSLTCRTSVIHVNTHNMETCVEHVEDRSPEDQLSIAILKRPELHRLQYWDFTHFTIPSLQKTSNNIIISNCKFLNNLGVDISSDGRCLCAVVFPSANDAESCYICVFSLEQMKLGECLYSKGVKQSVMTICFSPLHSHLIVGVSHGISLSEDVAAKVVGYIFKLGSKKNLSKVMTLKLQFDVKSISESRIFSNANVNAVSWHPMIKYGLIAFGTNKGGVHYLHV